VRSRLATASSARPVESRSAPAKTSELARSTCVRVRVRGRLGPGFVLGLRVRFTIRVRVRVRVRDRARLRVSAQHLLGEVHAGGAPLVITPRREVLAPFIASPRHDEAAPKLWPRRQAVSSAGGQRPAQHNPGTRGQGGGGRDEHQPEHLPALRRQPNATSLVCAAPK